MLTECPSCSTVFRVTGAILKIGHGQVRCGKCRKQFDALESLLDEEQVLAEPTHDASVREASEAAAIEAREPDIAEEIILEGSRIEISGTYRVPASLSTASADDAQPQIIHEHVVIDRDEPASGDAAADSPSAMGEDDIIEISVDDGEPVADAANHLLSDVAPAAEKTAQGLWERKRDVTHDAPQTGEIDRELAALTQPTAGAPRHTVWTLATIALAIALTAQWVHHNRDALVRDPTYGGAISNVYRTLGLTLAPNWDLQNYELQQWGVVSDNAARDALRVRASVTNNAGFAQPYPFIKLALEDRWGAPVAMREFSPDEYLPSTAVADRMMAPRQRTNAEIVIADPGVDAVGFQLHACLPRNGVIVCSDDLAARK